MQSIVATLERFFLRWVPEAFTVAILLSFLTFIFSVSLTDFTLTQSVASWGDGFWNLLTFTGQITLTLLLGFAVANTSSVKKF